MKILFSISYFLIYSRFRLIRNMKVVVILIFSLFIVIFAFFWESCKSLQGTKKLYVDKCYKYHLDNYSKKDKYPCESYLSYPFEEFTRSLEKIQELNRKLHLLCPALEPQSTTTSTASCLLILRVIVFVVVINYFHYREIFVRITDSKFKT
jgi:hypothetical protein